MRKPRWKAPASFATVYYHCISRVVDRQFVLGEEEREKFVEFMREYERFSGVRMIKRPAPENPQVGQRRAFAMAVSNDHSERRYGGLLSRLQPPASP